MIYFRLVTISLLLFFSPICYAAYSSPFSADTLVHSKIKSLSDSSYHQLKDGAFSEMDNIADVNQFPSADKVLTLASALALTDGQLKKIKEISAKMAFKTREMGGYLLKQEQKLNDLFASGKINEGSIIYHTNKIGLYHGELRNAYLQANYQTKKVLNLSQLKKYKEINGY